MNPNEINTDRLDMLGIYELRELGRMVGVTCPTAMRRDDLVASIKSCIELGDVKKGPARGRKPKTLKVDFSKILDNDGLNSYFNSVLTQSLEPQVRASAGDETRTVLGYVHLLPSGSAVLIGLDLNGYLISLKLLRTHSLKTGDFLEGKAIYNASRAAFTVEEVLNTCTGERYDSIKGVRPSVFCKTIANVPFIFGERVLVVTPKPFDRIQELFTVAADIKDTQKIALLIDETEDAANFLQGSVQEVFLTKVNYSIQKQTMTCLLALFSAKAAAEQGKQVVLFIDSLNKLFKIYNNSAYPDGRIDPMQVNLASLADLKTFFLSARALKNGGSLSVVSFVNAPDNQMEDYIYNEFADLAQRIIKK